MSNKAPFIQEGHSSLPLQQREATKSGNNERQQRGAPGKRQREATKTGNKEGETGRRQEEATTGGRRTMKGVCGHRSKKKGHLELTEIWHFCQF